MRSVRVKLTINQRRR